jgi:hypothetical protein
MDVEVEEFYGENKTSDFQLAKRVAEYLFKHYPGHPWLVGANIAAGVVDIHLAYPVKVASKMGSLGHYIHVASLTSDAAWKKVMRAGGDLLERYNMARRGYRDGDWQRARDNGLDATGALK